MRATWRITFVTPCPTSAAAQWTSAASRPSLVELHARGAVVVEALGVADVLEPDGEADAAANALARASCCRRRRGGGSGRAAAPRGAGGCERGAAADHLRDRQRAGHPLPGRQRVAGGERVPEPQLDGIEAELGGELVHLRLVREARLHGAEAAHRAAGRVVGVDARASIATFGTRTGRTANDAAFEVTAVELEAYAPPSSRIRMRTQTSLPSRFARCSAQIRAGWRWMWPTNDSSRL